MKIMNYPELIKESIWSRYKSSSFEVISKYIKNIKKRPQSRSYDLHQFNNI